MSCTKQIITMLCSFFVMLNLCAADQKPDWWLIQRALDCDLYRNEIDFSVLAKTLAETKASNATEAMYRVAVFMRWQMDADAVGALRKLKEFSPELESCQIENIYYDACKSNIADWNISKATVEIFSSNIKELALNNRLIKHFIENGWSAGKVDSYLSERYDTSGNPFWFKERVRFNVEYGRGVTFINGLLDDIRKNPQNIAFVVRFFDASSSHIVGRDIVPDLSWMSETIKPERALDAWKIAEGLKRLKQYSNALFFYERAAAIPLGKDEIDELNQKIARCLFQNDTAKIFSNMLKRRICECFLALNRKEEAQKLMLEIDPDMVFAGEVQAVTGCRIVENKLKEEEKFSENDPRFWERKAEYYRGRKEPKEEEDALLHGLACTLPQIGKPEHHIGWRKQMFARYISFLEREERNDEAVSFILKEIKNAPPDSESSRFAAGELAIRFKEYIDVDDDVLWGWLAKRSEWSYAEERLLLAIFKKLKKVPDEKKEKYFLMAENLISGHGPDRAYVLGVVFNSSGLCRRAILLLADAFNRSGNNGDLKKRTASILFEAYLAIGDWRSAEKIFPELLDYLTPLEFAERHSTLAVAAAAGGNKEDAMRLWRITANLNPSEIENLDALVKYGLKDELKTFYLEMGRKVPESQVPGKALEILDGRVKKQ